MKTCRDCQHTVSEQALSCPNCGAPYPWKEQWDGWGYEYKSKTTVGALPLVHIAFKYRPNRAPVVARGVIAIGQFGCGVITFSQFGVGVVSVSQFTAAGYALAQFAFAYECIAQVGVYINAGYGQAVWQLSELLKLPGIG